MENIMVIVINMPKARVIHMDVIRSFRNKKLLTLDLEMLKAIEARDEDKQSSIATEKQRLRDIPQTFDLSDVKTPAALMDLWPADLP